MPIEKTAVDEAENEEQAPPNPPREWTDWCSDGGKEQMSLCCRTMIAHWTLCHVTLLPIQLCHQYQCHLSPSVLLFCIAVLGLIQYFVDVDRQVIFLY